MRWLATLIFLTATPASADCVVLLHGLSRTEASMWMIEEVLEFHGYSIVNEGYPSNEAPIADLVEHVGQAVAQCGSQRTHFVTHSMGGILTRAWLRDNRPPQMGRVVMMAPPNHGTEIVDDLREMEVLPDLLPDLMPEVLEFLHGPAVGELGTGASSIPNQLPPVDYDLGVIAGNRAISPLGPMMIDGQNDGTVSVESTRIEGMADHIVLPTTHSLMMMNPLVIAEILEFLRNGAFDHGITLPNALRKLANP
ncbi:MAG: Alpha/beta hydrolase family [Rhodobacteraceae bacterium HLUCCA12]|nr:MAG: Alpha/beta hydrolase family [Rhodobacteraceae bacterium HLUCCA12]